MLKRDKKPFALTLMLLLVHFSSLAQSQQTLRLALSIAKQNNDQEAVQFIQGELATKM